MCAGRAVSVWRPCLANFHRWGVVLRELSVGAAEVIKPVGGAGEGGQTHRSLESLPPGVAGRVVCVGGSGAVARRLMEMGVVPGARVRVIKTAPLGDPIEVRVRNYHLALRRSEAQTISVVTSEE